MSLESMGTLQSPPVHQELEILSVLSWSLKSYLDFKAERTDSSLKILLGFSQALCLLHRKESIALRQL